MTLAAPQQGTVWQHKSGRLYTVLCIANHASDEQERYPATVVYQGQDGNIWSRRVDDWHRSMIASPEKMEICVSEQASQRGSDIARQIMLAGSMGFCFEATQNGDQMFITPLAKS